MASLGRWWCVVLRGSLRTVTDVEFWLAVTLACGLAAFIMVCLLIAEMVV